MEGQLKSGAILISESLNKYRVVTLLGAGGQGEVYKVECNGRHYALKWYFKHMATKEQKIILDNLITKGTPDKSFLWPQDLIYNKIEESYGYIMPLRPENFKSIVDMMKRRVEPTFYCLCRAAYNLTSCYQKLHSMGYSYHDISFGNLFFNPENGDVLICDNDNVSANGLDSCSVYGTPRFMAPEIVKGIAKPSRNTDLYSLAVLLFYMFMMGHPLEGKLEANIKCMDIHAMNEIYGYNPVFVYDPINKSNRPVSGYHDNVLIFWDLYPQKLRALFNDSFTTGLASPNKRVTENIWLDILSNLMTGIVRCPACDAEIFLDESKAKVNVAHICWNCNCTVQIPVSIILGKNRVVLTKGAKLFSHHIYSDYNMNTVIGTVVQNPNNPKVWGIRNMSNCNWTYIKSDGIQFAIPIGKSAPIAKDAKINFGQIIGEFNI